MGFGFTSGLDIATGTGASGDGVGTVVCVVVGNIFGGVFDSATGGGLSAGEGGGDRKGAGDGSAMQSYVSSKYFL
jgi:hypothetical protein